MTTGAFQKDAFQQNAFQEDATDCVSAFQGNAFQQNAFQTCPTVTPVTLDQSGHPCESSTNFGRGRIEVGQVGLDGADVQIIVRLRQAHAVMSAAVVGKGRVELVPVEADQPHKVYAHNVTSLAAIGKPGVALGARAKKVREEELLLLLAA